MFNTEAGKAIKISEIVSEEVSGKVFVLPVQEALDSIELLNYGTGIKSIHLMVVAVPPENRLHENRAEFNHDDKSVTLELNLSFPHALKAPKSEVTKMVAYLFIILIDLYEKWEIDDFDLAKFKIDLKSLFKSKGLLT